MALRTVGVRLAAEVSGYVNNMRTAGRSTRDFVGDLDKAAKAGNLDAVADQAGRMGLGMVAAFGIAVGAAARFDKQMSEVGAVSNATGADLERLRKAALQAGKDTAFSATEAAKAQAELAKAGLSTSQILGGALSGSLSLASAGSLDLAESADIAAKTMNVFQLEGKDVGHIADVLAAAANKSATDVHEMGEALRMGGLAANSAGMSLEETVGTLSAFADRALVGSDAGTSMKTMLQMLAAPTEKARSLMEKLGIAAYDASGNFIGTTKLAGQLQSTLGTLTQEQRNAALATIFGADAMRAANVLYEIGEEGIADYAAAVDDQGAAAEVAAKKMDNLAGDVERLTGSLETMAIEAGSGANGGMRTLVQMADALVNQFGSLHPVISSSLVVFAGIGGAALLGVAGMIRLRRASADALEELRRVGPTGERAADGLEKTGKHARRAAGALVALQVVGAIGEAFGDAAADVTLLASAMEDFSKKAKVSGEMARVYGGDLEQLNDDLKVLANNTLPDLERAASIETFGGLLPFAKLFDDSMTSTLERTKALDGALAQLVQSGNAQAAAAQFDEIRKRAEDAGISQQQLADLFPGYAQALKEAGGAAGDAATATGDMGAAAAAAAQDVEELKEAFDSLFEIQMDLDRATIEYKRGIIDLTAELKEGKRTLDLNTEAGQDNADALLDQVENIKDLRQANIDAGMSVDDANAQYEAQIAKLIALGIKLGYSETAIRDLIGAYGDIPNRVDTQVGAPGATDSKKKVENFNFAIRSTPTSWSTLLKVADATARREIAAYKRQLASIARTITTSFNVDRNGNPTRFTGNRWGDIEQMAAGGRIPAHTVSSPTVLYGERATGEEAYVPKYGDRDRSIGILSEAASWYGMQVGQASDWSSFRTTGGGPQVIDVRLTVDPGSNRGLVAELVRTIKVEVKDLGGGSVQTAFGRN